MNLLTLLALFLVAACDAAHGAELGGPIATLSADARPAEVSLAAPQDVAGDASLGRHGAALVALTRDASVSVAGADYAAGDGHQRSDGTPSGGREAASQAATSNTELWLGVEPKWWLLGLGLAGLVTVMFKADDGREKRRRKSIRASAACERIGLKRFAALFESYAVGDFTGVTKDVHQVALYLRKAGSVEEIAMSVIETSGPLLLDHPLYAERVRKSLTPKPAAAAVTPPEPMLR